MCRRSGFLGESGERFVLMGCDKLGCGLLQIVVVAGVNHGREARVEYPSPVLIRASFRDSSSKESRFDRKVYEQVFCYCIFAGYRGVYLVCPNSC
jgi:hypothetical protein